MTAYETQALLGLGVSRCQTRVSAEYRHNTATYNYIELCSFLMYYRCRRAVYVSCSVSVSILH
jgi:hypothetical protein